MGTRTVLGLLAAAGAWGAVWLVARSAPVPGGLGVTNGSLAPCPGTPNCILTTGPGRGASAGSDGDSPDGARAESPAGHPHLVLSRNDEATWGELVRLIGSMPRTRLIETSGAYVHAEVRTAVFRFVDDLELLRLRETGRVQVRSASRLGQGDLGVNARRVGQIRERAAEAGLIEPPA